MKIEFTAVSSTSVMYASPWFTWPDAPLPPPDEDALVSDEYKEFLAWKQKREEEKNEEPPKLVRPMRLIEL